MLAKKIALGFGIAVIYPLMLYYGVSSFSPPPPWGAYQVENFEERHRRADVEEQKQLEAERVAQQEKFREERIRFQEHLFFVTVPFGIIAIIAGTFIMLPAVGTGLIFGGVLSVINGYMGYWMELPAPMRFISLLAAFIVLLFVGYKKLEKRGT